MSTRDFDVDDFLRRPLTARVATVGPTVRPTWFLWEDEAFWILTGPWAKLLEHLERDRGRVDAPVHRKISLLTTKRKSFTATAGLQAGRAPIELAGAPINPSRWAEGLESRQSERIAYRKLLDRLLDGARSS